MFKSKDPVSVNKKTKPRILLIMRDPPDTEANKGGLFPTAIRHHVELGFDVYVASLSEMSQRHKEAVYSLGATPAIPPTGVFSVRKLMAPVSGRGATHSRGPDLTKPKNLSWIEKEINPDVVTGLQSFRTGIVAREVAKALGVKYLTWEHVSTYARHGALPVSDKLFAEFLKDAYAVLVVSASLREAIDQRFPISLTNLGILPNPIPWNFTKLPSSPKPEWLDEIADKRYLFASWTSWRDLKRLDLLLDAFKEVCCHRQDAMLIIAGSVDQGALKIIERFSQGNPDTAKLVRFVGKIDREAIRHLSAAADCCVIASDYETFGLPMVESIAVGTPVVSTRCGGPEDILVDCRLGNLCEKGSANALSVAMMNVMDNRESFKRDQIAKIADELLGEAAIKRNWADVYKGIVPGIGNDL